MTTHTVHGPRRSMLSSRYNGLSRFAGQTANVRGVWQEPPAAASGPQIRERAEESVSRNQITTVIQTVASLSPATVDAMYDLHHRHFENDDPRRFRSDLAEKQWVILVEAADGTVAGFSTIQELRLETDQGPAAFMFSGDTIVDPSAWSANALPPAIAWFINRFIERNKGTDCWWFLICKGFRTYRCLPLFFRDFVPSCEGPSGEADRILLDQVARYKFGDAYNSATGVISHPQPLDYLNDALRAVPEKRSEDPHIRFFFERNPGWTRGDELACLARLSGSNLRRSAHRVMEAGRRSVQWRI